MAAAQTSAVKKGKADGKEVLQQQEIIQAVVIADSFSEELLPLTSKKPTALLPVVNRTLLDYVLQGLEDCEINETFVFCSYLSPLIRNYVSNSRWSGNKSRMTVTVISSESFISAGDVLRELDGKNLIRSDFILINGGVISSLPLLTILEEHKKHKQNDKGLVMTVVYRKALPQHRTRCLEDDYIFVLNPSNKIRHFEKVKNAKPGGIPKKVFLENDDEVYLHYDLLNCHISICSPSVPSLYSDNFDYQTQDDFIKGLLVNEDIMNCSVYVSIAEHGYGACLTNMYMYDVISRDIMERWTYPVVPDKFPSDGSRYNCMRHNIYKEGDIELGRGCCTEINVVIGKGSKIGDNTFIRNSVIGQNCIIGANVHIVGSHLWNNVNIGDGCSLDTCLLADNVILKENVKILPGSVLSYNVVIGKGISVPQSSRLQAEVPDEDSDFGEDNDESSGDAGEKDMAYDPKLVGVDGRGFICPSPVRDNESTIRGVWGQLDRLKIAEMGDKELEEDSASSVMSGASETLDNANDSPYQDDDALSFYNEVRDSLERAIKENITVENLILEINSFKHAYNVTIKEVNTLVIKAILKFSQKNLSDPASPKEFLKALHISLQFFHSLLSNYIKSASSQMDCILAIEEFMVCNKEFSPAFVKILSILYDKNILSETTILKWYCTSSALSSEQLQLRKQAATFVKWLQEAEEESTDDESED